MRAVIDGKAPYDTRALEGPRRDGLPRRRDPEAFGGSGAGHLELCVIAEEMGRALAPVPFSSTVYLAAEALLLAGSDAQKQKWLPKHCAAARRSARWRCSKASGNPSPKAIKLTAANGMLNGTKKPVADGAIADFAIVAARTGSTGRDSDIALFLVDLTQRRRRGQGADLHRSDRAARPRSPSRTPRPSRSAPPTTAGASSRRCLTAPPC